MIGTDRLVTVIVTSYTMERLDDLTKLLSSLEKQTYRNFEIVLVLEKSQELFSKLGDYVKQRGYSNIRLLFNSGTEGLSAARNLGISQAQGEIIAFIDDDALATPDWLQEMVKTYHEDDNVIGVTGPIIPLWEKESAAWFPEEFYWIFACTGRDDCQLKAVRNGYGTNMSFRKEAFERSGLFLTHLGARGGGATGKHELVGEDTEFSIRARVKTGKRIMYVPGMLVQHRVYQYRLKWGFLARRAYWEGYTKVLLKKKNYSQHQKDVLATEHRLLKRIVLKLLPSTIAGFVKEPVVSWRRFQVTLTVLTCVAFGYFRGMFCRLDNKEA